MRRAARRRCEGYETCGDDEGVFEMEEMNMAITNAEVAAEETAAPVSAEEMSSPTAAPAEDKKSRDLREFRDLFPEAAADPKGIDKAVWQAVREGRGLAVAYACHALAAAKAENESLKANLARLEKAAEHARRSTGSLVSAGSDGAARDAFTAGWNG